MKLTFASFSNCGPRSSNQDRLLAPKMLSDGAYISAISDGVGGSKGGTEAAEIAISQISKVESADVDFSKKFSGIASDIRLLADTEPTFSKMATTLSVVLIDGLNFNVAHVGDTRIYQLRGEGIRDLTQDQTEVAELTRKKIISKSQAARYPRKGVLLSALSPKGKYELFLNSGTLQTEDRLVLVSDGVYQRVLRKEIRDLSLASDSPSEFASQLEKMVLAKGPTDNYSAVIVQIFN